MRVSALERLFAPERHRRRITAHGDFAQPLLLEQGADAEQEPLLATNLQGQLVEVKRSEKRHVVRMGFFPCEPSEEAEYLPHLFKSLWQLSVARGWGNRCEKLSQAASVLGAGGFEPRHLVIPPALLEEACGADLSLENAEELMRAQGYVTEVDDLKVLVGNLPGAILAAAPMLVGVYARSDNYLSLLVRSADRSLVLVRNVGGAGSRST
jgi:hypothetical protein